MTIKILDVGQCDMDGSRMATLWKKQWGATVDRCHLAEDALKLASKSDYSLILVNRILDADNSSGLDLIRDLIKTGTSAPVMLVSNFPEAQQAAVALGAVQGFGKADLNKSGTIELVQRALNARNAT